ncbi:putative DNA-binding domain-containing protein [Pseudomonas sp. TH08]|uniref:HvfC/BufC N-terminal domain-containing protein n=1 Tax=Pseudomonas sp. TH08 TaxID=2796374 RepID=UPI0019145294|nr:DNA-binding domain-containing protein [Pseudomonas sp. TH08]MBK5532095.1 putative DNA-binding domain-containing protein [Pseudomonas sp. TH08]
MRLKEWQLAFESFLLDGPATANPSLGNSLIGGPTLDVGTGLAIYHNAYKARLLEVLRNDFPAIAYWMGDEEFDALATTYIRQYPSAHYSLRWLGKGFEGFIREHLVPQQSAPLAELAALEWAFTLAFDAPEGHPLTLETMAALAAEEWPELRVKPTASLQWLACGFNSLSLWRSVKEGGEFPDSVALEIPQVCLIWRHELICNYRSLEPAEANALNGLLSQDWNFAELCAALAVIYGEGAPLQAVTWLKQWVQDGVLERLQQ